MSGNVTGFQRPYTFVATEGHDTVGTDQAVVYGENPREVIVPDADNIVPVGVVTYQETIRDGETVAVQLDRIAEVVAEGDISFGDLVIVGAGGVVKPASTVTEGNVNVLGEAQNTVTSGQKVQVLIRPRTIQGGAQ